jgi:hypothetical protein
MSLVAARLVVAALVGLPVLACSSTPSSHHDPDDAKSADSKKESGDAKEAKHARAIELAKRKLAHAQLERRAESAKHSAAIDQAQRELDLAKLELTRFDAGEALLRVRKQELDAKQKEDELAESREEFKQLEMMYAEQDLADKTRELVVQRQQRRIDLAAKELELEHDKLVNLKNAELAQERGKLEVEISAKQHALDAAKLDGKVGEDEKDVALLEAQHALADAEAGGDDDDNAKSEE